MGGRMAPAGGSTTSGFDAPSGAVDKPQLPASAVRPIELGGMRAEGSQPPVEAQLWQLSQQAQQAQQIQQVHPHQAQQAQQAQQQHGESALLPKQQSVTQAAQATQQQAARPRPLLQREEQPCAEEDGPPEGPQLCAEGRRLAELHAALLRCCSAISLSGAGSLCVADQSVQALLSGLLDVVRILAALLLCSSASRHAHSACASSWRTAHHPRRSSAAWHCSHHVNFVPRFSGLP